MKSYRVGSSWGVTIVEMGGGPQYLGKHKDDRLVAVIVDGDRELAHRIVDALNEEERRGH